MSWSVIVQNLQEFSGFEPDTVSGMLTQHPMYGADMINALETAKAAGLKSCTLSGGRTVSPYGLDEVVTISIVGLAVSTDFVKTMQDIARAPEAIPDDEFARQQISRLYSAEDFEE